MFEELAGLRHAPACEDGLHQEAGGRIVITAPDLQGCQLLLLPLPSLLGILLQTSMRPCRAVLHQPQLCWELCLEPMIVVLSLSLQPAQLAKESVSERGWLMRIP